MHRKVDSATVSQLAFPREGNPKFPWRIPTGTIQYSCAVCQLVKDTVSHSKKITCHSYEKIRVDG